MLPLLIRMSLRPLRAPGGPLLLIRLTSITGTWNLVCPTASQRKGRLAHCRR
jgi:hypothetical protein